LIAILVLQVTHHTLCEQYIKAYFKIYVGITKLSLFDSMQKFQETVLMAAAREGSVGMVRKMIQHGANVNIANKVIGNLHP